MSKKLVLKKDVKSTLDHTLLIASQGHSRDRIIQSSYQNLIPSRSNYSAQDLQRPSEEEVTESTLKIQESLSKIVDAKLTSSQPKSVAASVTNRGGATYIRYKSNSLFNNGEPMERIIKIVDKQLDPMLPVKFKIKRLPTGPPSPPAPILHEPSAKLTLQDHKDWYIPPAISNWKNQKGFTIAVDKRMAYLDNNNEPEEINDRFSKLSDALEKAEQDAREELKLKNELRLKLESQENQKRELRLKELTERLQQQQQQKSRGNYSDDPDNQRKYSTDSQSARRRELNREERRRKAELEIKLSNLSNEQKLRNANVSERVINSISQKNNNINELELDSRSYRKAALLEGDVDNNDQDVNVIRGPVAFERDEIITDKTHPEFGLQDKDDKEAPLLKKSKFQ